MFKSYLFIAPSLLLFLFSGSCASRKAVTNQENTSQATTLAEEPENNSPKTLQEKYEQGVDFAASGIEPSWTLGIHGDALFDFKTSSPEDGSIKVPTSVVAELNEGENVSYFADTSKGKFVLKLLREDCLDAVTGKKLPYTVIVQYGKDEYKGCGSYLSDTRLDGKWTVVQLNGKEVTGEKKPYLSFSLADKRVSGNVGCNNISGSLDAKRNKLHFGAIAVTRMACPDMGIENELLELLNKSEIAYRIIEGKLLLFQDRNEVVLLKQ
ncbi:META domain-containing protein [Pontibacter cellulosilyticus]|uniref:META domain-containing protein n=1 Tax=Pontibacter cellulosilyticus TaxID=1720253 RepID=A0A923SKC8_9BACT|nr:META domain-containing protein [Pontibacter cellulosilyticus]MBC5994612.1 META domain-containing protein [Pontibacter cellulosilyticus]